MGADSSELRDWIDVLERAVVEIPDKVGKVVGRGALNIKNEWRRRWKGHHYIPALPYAINYDEPTVNAEGAHTEIGVDKERNQGPLGNLIEFGSVNNAPIPGGLPALEAEAPRFEKAIADLAEQLLTGDGRG